MNEFDYPVRFIWTRFKNNNQTDEVHLYISMQINFTSGAFADEERDWLVLINLGGTNLNPPPRGETARIMAD